MQRENWSSRLLRNVGTFLLLLLLIIIIIIIIIPVIIGATGNILKLLRKYVSNIPGIHEAKELQKTAILDTAHILRKVLM